MNNVNLKNLSHLFSSLTSIMRNCENGIIADASPEFLHDYRVALRKQRVLLSEFKSIFQLNKLLKFRETFSLLTMQTTDVRDYDIFLLNKSYYFESLGSQFHFNLEKVFDFIVNERENVFTDFVNLLISEEYTLNMIDWENAVKILDDFDITKMAIESVDVRFESISEKLYNFPQSQGEFHKLRIQFKKLRYIIELFPNVFYAEDNMLFLVLLRRIQDLLGMMQDWSVQAKLFKTASEKVIELVDGKIFIGEINALLEHNMARLRQEFKAQFEEVIAFDLSYCE